ncbi:MAG: NADH-quinone oxidoreductase subunit N [Pirellulaceae bacterium]
MFVDFNTVRDLWPELLLILLASWIFLGGTIQASRAWWTGFSIASYCVAAYVIVWKEGPLWSDLDVVAILSGPIRVDFMGYVFRLSALLFGILFTMVAARTARRDLSSEILGTLMLLIVGLMLVARANDLVFLFVSLELISIPTYVLLFLGRRDGSTAEATIKYFFLSVLSSGLLLYGLSFLYGIAGTTTMIGTIDQPGIRDIGLGMLSQEGSDFRQMLAIPALVLLLAGLGFKIAAVPFHFYAPDVYEGTTNANAGLLAVIPKVAGILALIRLVVIAFPIAATFAWQLCLVLAILTMSIGNVCALWQQNIRRLMAYSSVAHAGYLLIGLAVATAAAEIGTSQGGIAATLFYVFVYALASLGTFAALSFLGGKQRELSRVDELAGLARIRPMTAAAIAVCMFSLAGIPPLAGFWGKLTLFLGAVDTATISASANQPHLSAWFVVLAVAGALNAAVAAAYYLRIIAVMYFGTSTRSPQAEGGWGAWFAMSTCALLVVALGVFPKTLLDTTMRSERSARAAAISSMANSARESGPFDDVARAP